MAALGYLEAETCLARESAGEVVEIPSSPDSAHGVKA